MFFMLFFVSLAVLSSMQRSHRPPRDESDDTRLEIAVLTDALEMYALDHDGHFPSGAQGLGVLKVRSNADEAWKGPYLRDKTNLLDAWGTPLLYDGPPAGSESIESRVWSAGPDKVPNTADDVHR